VEHRLWTVEPDPSVARSLADEPLLIADGHHRYTTALAYRDERRATDGPGLWDRILTLVVDTGTERVPVLPFHRIQLDGDVPTAGTAVQSIEAALDALSDRDVVVATAVREGNGVLLRTLALAGDPPAVEALHEQVLPGVSSASLRFTPDAADAVELVRTGSAVAAYLLPGTTPDTIRSVIERGGRLPQKSTYFWPKPRTGVVLMPLDGPALADLP
jgi:hypothetical protein